ncbi:MULTISPECIES: hypothetical protein [Marinobacter]|uniref:Uncharacterized protein n=3 Tax=Marinobacter nauticus TaxID=2743 RepID=A0A368V610_MARNT|nr:MULTISPECIES: hypothetical protein [Marinobacter]MCG8523554.1 hypothetical protein [Pseudomonadales bacterium]ABM17210.1 hypothetical protein Maqu_0103 [Marinobacter nauticus VT8]KAE8547364.1 hypothetical protein F6453_0256 [Marinobacter nauticus]MAC22492.1 hypothetical protein [Marinobacter sp.]MAH32352.1 hypothetical protein [Marinobacter sp.]
MRRHPTSRAANQPMTNRQAPIKRPEKLPLLDAICKKLNQRVNLDDEQRVLGLYERGWIFKGVLSNLDGAEARYVRALATRYNSWIARQVA